MSQLYGFLTMFLAATIYGVSGIIIKMGYLYTSLTPDTLLTLQNIVAIICLWFWSFVSGSIVKLTQKQMVKLIIQGIFGNLALSASFFWAAQLIDVSLLVIIMFTYPAAVAVYKIIVENRPVVKLEWLALVMVIAGAVLAVDPFKNSFGQIDKFGLILAFGTTAASVFLNVFGEKFNGENLAPQFITAITLTVSTIGLFFIISPTELIGKALTFNSPEWLIIFGCAASCAVVPLTLMYVALRLIGAFYVSIISVFEVPCVLVLAAVILKEDMNWMQILGGMLIVMSIIILQIHGRRLLKD